MVLNFAILVCFSIFRTGVSSASGRAHITAVCTVTSSQGWTPRVTLTLINFSQFLSVRVIIFPNSPPCLVTSISLMSHKGLAAAVLAHGAVVELLVGPLPVLPGEGAGRGGPVRRVGAGGHHRMR